MAKKSGLHITEAELEAMMKRFGDVNKGQCINEAQNQYIYTINIGSLEAKVAVYFRSDNTISCVKQGSGESGEKSQEIVSYIKENANFNNVSSGTFTCKFTEEKFEKLKNYLCTLDGVTLKLDENKGVNGHLLKFISNIGDSITLTFWKTTGKMCFQGYLMLLHAEVKSFISAYEYVKTELFKVNEEQKSEKELMVQKMIQQLMPVSYNKLDALFQDYIHDSIMQIVMRNQLREYSAWTFPILKALEGRIKQILGYNNVRIKDSIGFKIKVNRESQDYEKIFLYENGKHVVNTGIVSIQDGNTLNVLSDCYTYICQNRNPLFHVKYTISGTRKVTTPEDAENIIYEACKMIEQSYILIRR